MADHSGEALAQHPWDVNPTDFVRDRDSTERGVRVTYGGVPRLLSFMAPWLSP